MDRIASFSNKLITEYGGAYPCCIMLPAGWSCGYTVQFAKGYYNGGGAGYCSASC